ncbi:hypothetical protein ALT785_160037 [Alteromonas infernus]|jgi:hypothetical protein|tara:strand:- start:1283 stop:1432 length:150 start_codon:yes stop_codon:yes gene_type:complete
MFEEALQDLKARTWEAVFLKAFCVIPNVSAIYAKNALRVWFFRLVPKRR